MFFILTLYLTTIIQYSNYNRIYINIGFHMTYNVIMIKNAKFNTFPSAVLIRMVFHKQCILGRTNASKNLCKNVVFGWILVSGHFSKGLLELLSDCLVLLLLRHKLILKPVHLLLQFEHRFLGELGTGLGLLQLGSQGLDLLLVGLLPLVGLLLGHLQGLEVVGHNPQLLLQLKDLGLTDVSALLGLLEVGLAGGKLLGNLVVGGIGGLGFLPCLFQVLLKASNPLLVLVGLALEDLLGALRVVSSSSSLVKLGHSSHHLLLGLLKILLESRPPPCEGVHLKLGGSKLLLLLLQLQGGDGEALGGDVKLSLELPGLDQQLLHLVLALLGADPGRLHLLLADVRLVAGVVLLHLHRLHLLLDCLHLEEQKFWRI